MLEVNRQAVASVKTYERIAAKLQKDQAVLLLLKRQGRTIYLTLRPIRAESTMFREEHIHERRERMVSRAIFVFLSALAGMALFLRADGADPYSGCTGLG